MMDIPDTGGILLDSAAGDHTLHAAKQPPWLAFPTPIHANAARDRQQENSGPLSYAGPSNKG